MSVDPVPYGNVKREAIEDIAVDLAKAIEDLIRHHQCAGPDQPLCWHVARVALDRARRAGLV